MPGETVAMIRIDMTQQNSNHANKRCRHQGRAICEVAGRRFATQGPGADLQARHPALAPWPWR